MFCHQCGTQQKGSNRFCTACGTSLNRKKNTTQTFTPPSKESPEDIDFYQAAVGKNTAYYLPHFQKIADNPRALSWHWAAFFMGFYWLLYRKMWAWAVFYFLLPIIVLFLSLLFLPAAKLLWLLWLGFVWVIFPAYANTAYYYHCSRIIDRAESASPNAFGQLKYCQNKGGTSWLGIVLMIPLFIFLMGILAAISLPLYQNFIVKVYVHEGVASAEEYSNPLTQYYKRQRQWPTAFSDVPGLPEKHTHEQVHIQLKENGILHLTFHGMKKLENRSVLLVPEPREKGVFWDCRNVNVAEKYLPPRCLD